MASYGQFCPVAKAMEILDERWTLLIVRELLMGSTRFSELRRGVPKMSPALLSRRLRELARAGVVERHVDGSSVSYRLTRSGRELYDVVRALAVWGVRWVGELGEQDLDPHLLLWDMHRTMPTDRWPPGRTVLAIHFTDVEPKQARWWLVVGDDGVDVCSADPGFEVAVSMDTSLRVLTGLWRGDRTWPAVLAAGTVRLSGSAPLRRTLPELIGRSTFAAVPRPGPQPMP